MCPPHYPTSLTTTTMRSNITKRRSAGFRPEYDCLQNRIDPESSRPPCLLLSGAFRCEGS